jgi:hypothetical protein
LDDISPVKRMRNYFSIKSFPWITVRQEFEPIKIESFLTPNKGWQAKLLDVVFVGKVKRIPSVNKG